MPLPKRLKIFWLAIRFGWCGHRLGLNGETLRDYIFEQLWSHVEDDAPGWSYRSFRRWLDIHRSRGRQ